MPRDFKVGDRVGFAGGRGSVTGKIVGMATITICRIRGDNDTFYSVGPDELTHLDDQEPDE